MAQTVIMYDCGNSDVDDNDGLDLLDTDPSVRVLTTSIHATSANGNTSVRARNNINRPAAGTTAVVLLPTGSQGEGNTVNNGPLKGQFTMPSAESHAVVNQAIRDGARVNLYPRNSSAWALQAGANRVSATIDAANTRFTLASAAGPAAGTEFFNYEIIQ